MATVPLCSRYGSVVRLSSGCQVLKVRHDLVIYPADPVIAKSDPFGPLPGMLQPQDMLTGIGLHGLEYLPIDDPHRDLSYKREYRDTPG